MESITNIAGLKLAIQQLEAEQAEKGMLLREQFSITYESLKPVNILKNAIKEITSSPKLIDSLLGTVTGLATGYLSKKIVVGGSGNIIRKLLGSVLEFGVANVVSQHPDTIKSVGKFIIQHIFHKKEMNSEKL